MTLLIMDGFDLGDRLLRWAPVGSTSDTTTTRFSYGRAIAWSFAAGHLRSFTPKSEVYAGFAFYQTGSNSNLASDRICFLSGGTNIQLSIRWVNATTLGAYRGSTLLASGASPEPIAFWVYIEVYFKVHASAGRAVVKVNGATIIDFTGNTDNQSTGVVDAVRFVGLPDSNTTMYADDFYLLDSVDATATQGAPFNNFLGDVRVYTLSPSGAGTDTQMTPSSGANYTCVDEKPYSAADYVQGSAGQRDTYATEDLAGAGAVLAVQAVAIAKKTDAGALSAKTAIRSGGAVYAGTATALGTSDAALTTIHGTNPATSAAWTVSGVNAAEVGAEVV